MTSTSKHSYPRYLPSIPYPTPHTPQTALHTVDVWLPHDPSSTPAKEDSLWVINIHGGAWRDPAETASTFQTTINGLLDEEQHASILPRIAGFASISYRLSPYPTHPTDPSSPTDPARNIQHPGHVHDVEAGLRYLQVRYGFGERYLLVGHSCGATLGWQVLLSTTTTTSTSTAVMAAGAVQHPGNDEGARDAHEGSLPAPTPVKAEEEEQAVLLPPLGMIGVAGIYDIPGLLAAHASTPVYAEIIAGAFGTLETDALHAASPIVHAARGGGAARVALVVHSTADELVEEGQATGFVEALRGAGWTDVGRPQASGAARRGAAGPAAGGGGGGGGGGGRGGGNMVELIWEDNKSHKDLWACKGGMSRLVRRAVELLMTPTSTSS
ncbi:MAG: hypothetical protein M1837_005590 [Sclerophora amabilis]|nr:MAG: hypothetical protein M1837_005590 [Sclerophora amabilis]